jgi:hypothetical protein
MSYHYGYSSGSGSGGILGRGIMALQNAGILDIILPFILVFTIVFAILQKTKILGTETDGRPKKNFNTVISLVMGLAVVIPHVTGMYPSPNMDVVNIINASLPNISVVLVAIIMMLLMIGAFGGNVDMSKSKIAGWAVLFSIVAVIFIFGTSAYWWNLPNWAGFLYDSDTQALIVILLVFGALIAFITAEDTPEKDKKPSFIEDLANIMKK